jgi:hypothetical protein
MVDIACEDIKQIEEKKKESKDFEKRFKTPL